MMQNLLEKLQLKEEKNLLIQGMPSSIEKQFAKLSFSKNVTPLLRSKRIDFALVFAVDLQVFFNVAVPAERVEEHVAVHTRGRDPEG